MNAVCLVLVEEGLGQGESWVDQVFPGDAEGQLAAERFARQMRESGHYGSWDPGHPDWEGWSTEGYWIEVQCLPVRSTKVEYSKAREKAPPRPSSPRRRRRALPAPNPDKLRGRLLKVD